LKILGIRIKDVVTVKLYSFVFLLALMVSSVAPTVADDAPPLGKYACGVFLSGKYIFTQYVTLKAGGEYESSTSGTGKYKYTAATKHMEFTSGKLQSSFGSYEAGNNPLFRLTSKDKASKSAYEQKWASQVCSLRK